MPVRDEEAAAVRRARVLIAEATSLYRDNLVAVLRAEPGVAEVLTAADVFEALDRTEDHEVDVILVHVALVRATPYDVLAEAVRKAKLVALGVDPTDEAVVYCAEAGIHGWLLRSEGLGQLLEVIAGVAVGETRCSPRISSALRLRVAELARERGDRQVHTAQATVRVAASESDGAARLTPRELDVARCMADGLADKQIAVRLGISVRTVKNHVHNILGKLGVSRRGEVAARLPLHHPAAYRPDSARSGTAIPAVIEVPRPT